MACAVKVRSLEWVRDAFEASEVLAAAVLPGDSAGFAWVGAAIDSRADCAGRIFFALTGDHTDGHQHLDAAMAAGCVAVVVSDRAAAARLVSKNVPHFVVTDTRDALTGLAAAYRRHLTARVVAVTGSSGKTTTKEYVRAVLRTKYRVHANAGNFNSLVGVPITVLDADEHCEYLVCEVGANHRGEIAQLGDLLRPHLAVITNIGDAHIGYFGSRDAIAREKGSILSRLAPGGRAVLPRDDEYFEKLDAMVQGKVSSFGRAPSADFRLGGVGFSGGALQFSVNGERLTLAAVGEYNAMNACAAFATGDACGIDVARIRTALAGVSATPGRGRVHTFAGVVLVDESYNASPASMHRSLAMLTGLPASRRIAVLGDMKELGDQSERLHREVGAEVVARGIDRLYWFGEQGGVVREAVAAAGARLTVETFGDQGELARALLAELKSGDAVLVKASRACRLDEVVALVVNARAGN